MRTRWRCAVQKIIGRIQKGLGARLTYECAVSERSGARLDQTCGVSLAGAVTRLLKLSEHFARAYACDVSLQDSSSRDA
jgi:hypothetical protein